MDAGVTGAVIGISIMGCLLLTVFCYEKIGPWSISWKQQRQPLLPVVVLQNPIGLRKHFQMKQLVQKK